MVQIFLLQCLNGGLIMHQKIDMWAREDCQDEPTQYVKRINCKPEKIQRRNFVIGLGHPPGIIDQCSYYDSLPIDYGQQETFPIVKSHASSQEEAMVVHG